MNLWILASLAILLVYVAHVLSMRQRLYVQVRKISRLEHDLSEMESILKRREKRLDVLFSSVNEAVFRVDRQGSVLTANTRAKRLFQPEGALVLPQSMLVFYRDPDWNNAFSRALHALPKASALPDIHVGERVLVARLAPLGKNQALLLCVDMTEQARLEKQRQTFLTNLIHDLKTPLTSILGYARSIRSFADKPELQLEAAEVLASEAKHVNSLLESLLTLDRIGHASPLHTAEAMLPVVCQQVCDLLSFQCEERQVNIQPEIPEDMPALAIDFDDLTRILMNVLTNALHFSPKGGSIGMGVQWQGSICTVSITDEGPGIPDKHLGHVTERFYQVDAARSKGGHGLGLAIVRELLDVWGGELSLRNRKKQGLRVTFRLPLVDVSQAMDG